MPFNTALSGIRAASGDLAVTGNNIANASTTGFKGSRAEFGDVYATSILGDNNNSAGSGVRLQNIAQQFKQGNVSFTENELDLAIRGNGFFVVRQAGQELYSRAGTFGIEQGHIVNNAGARLQGYSADSAGNISGLQTDIRIEQGNMPPRSTTEVLSQYNLNSAEPVLQSRGNGFRTEGNAIGVTQVGLEESTTTTLASGTDFTLPLGLDFSTQNIHFDISLTGSSGDNGTVSIHLDANAGVPPTVATLNDLRTLAGAINTQLHSPVAPQMPIDVIATAVDAGGGNYRLEFTALRDGESSEIRVENASGNATALELPVGPATATSIPGVAAVSNGYPGQAIDIVDAEGNTVTYNAKNGASAAATASELNSLAGVSATASNNMRLLAANYNNSAGNLQVNLNGVTVQGNTLQQLGIEINALTGSTLPGISAELDPATGDLIVNSVVGDDLKVKISSTTDGDSVGIVGNPGALPEILEVDHNNSLNNAIASRADGNAVVVGGEIDIVLSEGYTAENAQPPSIGLFGALTDSAFSPIVINAFDPSDQATYNSASSATIFDSLGNSHVMTQFFVRQEHNPNDPTTSPNHWVMHVQIDGENVGDPDTTLPPPDNTVPTMASYNVYFNENGSLNQVRSDEVLISNWTPKDKTGAPNGAMGPQNLLAGGTTNIPETPTSSNFVIDLSGTTQFGSAFAINNVRPNGYTTGRLSGLNIEDDGRIFARYTNDQSQVLGQVVLANFDNYQGLEPVGDTMWAENYHSGPPQVGAPGSAALGTITASALEDSNVDLSDELVNLIVAQRNFQASAKTIETADTLTQTIINMR